MLSTQRGIKVAARQRSLAMVNKASQRVPEKELNELMRLHPPLIFRNVTLIVRFVREDSRSALFPCFAPRASGILRNSQRYV